MMNIQLSLITLIIFLLTKPYKTLSLTQEDRNTYLTIHNTARAQVGVGPLSWDDKLESYAQDLANKVIPGCIPTWKTDPSGPYGENIAAGYGAESAWEVAGQWAGEKDRYNYSSNSCVNGECKHYTQVVWSKSVKMGCGSVLCGAGWPFAVCEYDPPGNVKGERPY